MDKTIEIRSNILQGFNAHLKRVVDDEEREKEERQRKLAQERENREREFEEWKKTHPNTTAYSYVNEYSFKSPSPYQGGYCRIYFYEWSDLERIPMKFEYFGPFFLFLDSCGIIMTREQNNEVRPWSSCYVACRKGSKELVVGSTYEMLKSRFNMANAIEKKEEAPSVGNTLPVLVGVEDI